MCALWQRQQAKTNDERNRTRKRCSLSNQPRMEKGRNANARKRSQHFALFNTEHVFDLLCSHACIHQNQMWYILHLTCASISIQFATKSSFACLIGVKRRSASYAVKCRDLFRSFASCEFHGIHSFHLQLKRISDFAHRKMKSKIIAILRIRRH